MGFFARLKALIKSNLNDMISKAEDPEKMLTQILEDMRDQFAEAKRQTALAIADEKRLSKQFDTSSAGATSWEQKAMAAIKAGDDELAKKALLRKVETQQLAAQYREQYEGQHHAVETLKVALKELSRKIEEAKRKKNLLIAKKKRAEAQQSIQKTMEGLSDSSAFSAYARMEDKIEQMAAEAEASVELTSALNETDQLDQSFQKLEQEQTADAMLSELKQKMGKAPAALPPSEEEKGKEDEAFDLDAELENMKETLKEPV